MLEQWSEVRSRSVSRSHHTKPVSMLHCPCRIRRMCRVRICSFSASMTCSSGSTCPAAAVSFSRKARSASCRISRTARDSTSSSLCAALLNVSPLARSSSADSSTLTAWSEMRSKSPMVFSSSVASSLSAAPICWVLSFTR